MKKRKLQFCGYRNVKYPFNILDEDGCKFDLKVDINGSADNPLIFQIAPPQLFNFVIEKFTEKELLVLREEITEILTKLRTSKKEKNNAANDE